MLSSTTWPYGVTLRSPGAPGARARPVEVDAADVERVLAELRRAIESRMFSTAIAPCGPPKPRNAVLLCVLVRPE